MSGELEPTGFIFGNRVHGVDYAMSLVAPDGTLWFSGRRCGAVQASGDRTPSGPRSPETSGVVVRGPIKVANPELLGDVSGATKAQVPAAVLEWITGADAPDNALWIVEPGRDPRLVIQPDPPGCLRFAEMTPLGDGIVCVLEDHRGMLPFPAHVLIHISRDGRIALLDHLRDFYAAPKVAGETLSWGRSRTQRRRMAPPRLRPDSRQASPQVRPLQNAGGRDSRRGSRA